MARSHLVVLCGCLVALSVACGNSEDAGGASGAAGLGGSGAGGTSAGGAADSGAAQGGSTAASGAADAGAAGESGSSASAGQAGDASASCPAAAAGLPARLAVSEAQILDPKGKPIQLRGWNWGQWGSEQDQDAADNAAQGATIVRIPLRWWGYYNNEGVNANPRTRIDSRSDDEPGHIEAGHLRLLDKMIRDAACQGLWVDLFLDSNCGQASASGGTAAYCGTVANGDAANFANDPEAVETFTQTWEFLVARYKAQPFIAMYELLPEPHLGCRDTPCSNWDAAPAFYAPLIARVRAIDATTPLLIGPDGGYEIKQIDTAHIANLPGLIYTGNFLDGPAGHPEYIQYATDFETRFHAPVFIQQLGSRKDDADAAARATTILKAMNAAGIGWTWWTYRETKSSTGQGFAPYWENGTPPWHEDAAWLKLIVDQFH